MLLLRRFAVRAGLLPLLALFARVRLACRVTVSTELAEAMEAARVA
jgi:hypothetical protein